jgi:hypothetical protein
MNQKGRGKGSSVKSIILSGMIAATILLLGVAVIAIMIQTGKLSPEHMHLGVMFTILMASAASCAMLMTIFQESKWKGAMLSVCVVLVLLLLIGLTVFEKWPSGLLPGAGLAFAGSATTFLLFGRTKHKTKFKIRKTRNG